MTKNRQDKQQDGQLGYQLVKQMDELTRLRIMQSGLKNAELSLSYIQNGQSIRTLYDNPPDQWDAALVIAAGPSIKRQHDAQQIKKCHFKGTIIATESAMLYCLRNGIIPDLVVTIDPHASRIVRWFGDPKLSEKHLQQDDYFARQDLDESFSDELRVNQEILDLVNHYGPQIKIALSSSASPAVVKRAMESGMQVYWWNPLYDDPGQENSVSRELYQQNGLPCMNAGGNVGAACWMMADAVLNKQHIAVIGMDFGYYDDVPYKNTQYYHEAVELVGKDKLDSLYMRVFNPHLQQWFYTDPAYMWYKNCLLDMVSNTDSQTYNCTEGGILFGDGIDFIPLKQFLERFSA